MIQKNLGSFHFKFQTISSLFEARVGSEDDELFEAPTTTSSFSKLRRRRAFRRAPNQQNFELLFGCQMKTVADWLRGRRSCLFFCQLSPLISPKLVNFED